LIIPDHALGFPVLRALSLCTCCRHYPGAAAGCIPRSSPVNHSAEEYVRGDAHTNTAEGMFSILKREIYGIYRHVSEVHLQRYLHEFDFRYNNRVALGINDAEHATRAIQGAAGKRLTYRQPRNQAEETGAA
jgi:ISXO2-like transposase domain